MRLKYSSVFFVCVLVPVFSFSLDTDPKVTNKEWYCSQICKSSHGEPIFDKRTEKCYCTLGKITSPEEKESRDLMRKNAKMHNIHLIIEELEEGSNRVRRDVENEENTEPDATDTNNLENDPIVGSGNPTIEENEDKILTESNPENNIENNAIIVGPQSNTENTVITNPLPPKRARPVLKLAGPRKLQPKPIDNLVEETKKKIDELMAIHQGGQSPKEAQAKVKEIQGVVGQMYSNLKYTNDVQTIQDRINQLGTRHKTVASTQETKNTDVTTTETEQQDNVVGTRRHIPRHRITPRPRAEELERHRTITHHHPRSRIHRQRVGAAKTDEGENVETSQTEKLNEETNPQDNEVATE